MNEKVPQEVEQQLSEGFGKELTSQSLSFVQLSMGTFDVETTIEMNDFICHFYPPADEKSFFQLFSVPSHTRQNFQQTYWIKLFPVALSDIAQSYFEADFPRLSAKHIYDPEMIVAAQKPLVEFLENGEKKYKLSAEEKPRPLDSWWFRAKGFADKSIDPDEYILRFYKRLDASLRATKRT